MVGEIDVAKEREKVTKMGMERVKAMLECHF
jgi:hypothetical protein